jgi:hypothetical protein
MALSVVNIQWCQVVKKGAIGKEDEKKKKAPPLHNMWVTVSLLHSSGLTTFGHMHHTYIPQVPAGVSLTMSLALVHSLQANHTDGRCTKKSKVSVRLFHRCSAMLSAVIVCSQCRWEMSSSMTLGAHLMVSCQSWKSATPPPLFRPCPTPLSQTK